MSLSKIASARSQIGAFIPNVKPRKARVTEIGMVYYVPWWNGPVKVIRGLLILAALLVLALFMAYAYMATWLIRLLLGVRPTLHVAWPSDEPDADQPEPERTITGARRNSAKCQPKWQTVAGEKVFGTSVSMDELAEEPF